MSIKKHRDTTFMLSADFRDFIEELKARVIFARVIAARAITREAILLYWDISQCIVEKQKQHAWGDSVIDQVSDDLTQGFAGAAGYSPRNLPSAKQLFLTCRDTLIWLQSVAKIHKAGGVTRVLDTT